MIHLKIEQIGAEVGIIFDERALEILGVKIDDELYLESTEGGLLLHVPGKHGGRHTFNVSIHGPDAATF